jgi:hypothetical protein
MSSTNFYGERKVRKELRIDVKVMVKVNIINVLHCFLWRKKGGGNRNEG